MNTENGEIKTVTDKDGNVVYPKTVKAAIEDFPTVPTKTSELINDTGFITTIPTEYITETELNTELSAKANITDIPSLNGYATETFVTNKIAEASLSGGEIDLSGLATKDELALKADTSSIPSIDGLATKKELTDGLATKSDTAHNHDKTYSKLNHAHEQYLTEHQDISGKVDKVEGKGLSTNDLTNALKSNYDAAYTHSQSTHFSGSYNDLTNKPTIPTSLPANGGNANSVNGYSFMKLTQAEYDALGTKSENVIYIVED